MEKHATSHVKPVRAIMMGVIVSEIPVMIMSRTNTGAKLPKNILTRLDFMRKTSAACARLALQMDAEVTVEAAVKAAVEATVEAAVKATVKSVVEVMKQAVEDSVKKQTLKETVTK